MNMNITQYTYNTLVHYFNLLSYKGYLSDKQLKEVMLITILDRLSSNDYRGYLSNDDIGTIEKLYSTVLGTSCMLPFPSNCNNTSVCSPSTSNDIASSSCSNNLNSVGSLSELVHRLDVIENAINNNNTIIPTQPTNIRAIDKTSTSITVAWSGNAPNYKLYITSATDGVTNTYNTALTTFKITNLTPDTVYAIYVQAIYNTAYRESDTIDVRTLTAVENPSEIEIPTKLSQLENDQRFVAVTADINTETLHINIKEKI